MREGKTVRYQVTMDRRQSGDGHERAICQLTDRQSGELAEIYRDGGFNCFRWRTGSGDELLYSQAELLDEGSRPTRSGIPILFPFPNRIRDGRYSWSGRDYELPRNDPTGKNAIHGFVCQRPWRVVDQGADDASAWVTGEFRGATDAPETLAHWPADYQLRLTFRLAEGSLRLEAEAMNPDTRPLPFGLGYHPYFTAAADSLVTAPARAYWQLIECLPTTAQAPVDAARDLNRLRTYRDLQLDDVLTELPDSVVSGGLCLRGQVRHGERTLQLWAAPVFRELVVFTPPHREAMCIEPYTCVTDAINLQQRGVDAGWLVLAPGQKWTAVVELRVQPVKDGR